MSRLCPPAQVRLRRRQRKTHQGEFAKGDGHQAAKVSVSEASNCCVRAFLESGVAELHASGWRLVERRVEWSC